MINVTFLFDLNLIFYLIMFIYIKPFLNPVEVRLRFSPEPKTVTSSANESHFRKPCKYH